jgi:nucleoside-diphosphate-sugar epimerase
VTDAARRRPGTTLLVGCGALGTTLGERLVADGGAVTAIRRDASALPTTFATIEADLRHPLPTALPAFDSVVITLPPGAGPEGSIYPAALTHLAAALPTRPERVIFVSSTRVFEGYGSQQFGGAEGRAPLTEADPVRTTGDRGDALVAGEELAVDLFGAIVVRPAGIYGPGRDSLIRRVREGAPVDHERRTNRIHEHDLVRLLETLLRADAPPTLVHAIDREPVLLGEVVAHIAARLGIAVSPQSAGDAGGGTVLDGARAHALLGDLVYPTFREGYGDMLGR